MQVFIPALLQFRRTHADAELVVWKSDVSEAFRLTAVHKLEQIKQIADGNVERAYRMPSGALPSGRINLRGVLLGRNAHGTCPWVE
jgi:hypothetical protein